MKNAYIVCLKTSKNLPFSSKRGKKRKKQPVFGKNRAKIAVFSDFSMLLGADLQESQNLAFFAKSLVKMFEFSSNRDRVILSFYFLWASHLSPENKKPLTIARAAVLKS